MSEALRNSSTVYPPPPEYIGTRVPNPLLAPCPSPPAQLTVERLWAHKRVMSTEQWVELQSALRVVDPEGITSENALELATRLGLPHETVGGQAAGRCAHAARGLP